MNGSPKRGSSRPHSTWRVLFRAMAAAAVAGALLLGFLVVPGVSSAATPSASPATTASGTYVPVTPTRITDTRAGSGEPNAGDTIGPAASLTVQVGGVGGVPSNASVAVLNVTAINPTVDGFLSVNPGGQTGVPTVSNLNFVAGQTVANLVTVPLSASGAVSIFNHDGNTDVAVDVFGYYTPTPATDGSGLYNSVTPFRALGNLQSGAPIGPGGTTAVTVTGGGTGVPTSASAVVVNLTAASGTTPSFLTSYAAGTSQPIVSNLNFVANQVVANRATVPVGTGGQIEVFNHDGTVNVDVDISGYYTSAGGTGSTFVPVTPERLTDTRSSTNGTPIAPNSTEQFNLTAADIPANARAVATNVTAVAGNAPGFLTVYPTSITTGPPTASDVNWSANQVVPNFTIAPTQGTGSVNIFNNNGATLDVVIDAFGYFAPTPRVVVTANPGDIAPGTGTAVITATVSQPDGSPVGNDAAHIAASGPANVCGTLSPLSTVTNASGKATFNYSAGTASGVCTFTVTESSQSGKGTVAITQGNVIALTSASASVPADGTTTDALTAHVSTGGGPVVGDAVTFTASATPAGACGLLSPTTVNTDSSGNAVATYTSSTTPGFCAVTATESGSGNTSSTSINQTASSTVATVAVAATPPSITADGTSTSSITATVTGAASAPIVGDQVMFSVSSGGGTFVNAFATTNASGVATVTYTSSTSVGSFTITAQEANGANSGQGTITQTAIPFAVALSASPTSLPDNGLATSSLNVTITVPGGGPAGSGLAVGITSSGTCGSISSTAGTTAPGGTFTTTYQAGTTTGSCTITATGGPQNAAAPPVIITQTLSPPPSPAYAIAVTASPTSIQANAAASSTISATVTTDSGSTPVPGDPVTFTAGTGCGSLSAATATTSTSGVATTTLTATVTPGPCQITAVEADSAQSGSTNVTQVPATNAVTLSPPGTTNLLGNGTSTQDFTVRLTPAVFGGSVANDTVNFTVTGNPGAACGSVSPTSANTGTGSTVSATYTTSTTPGFCTVTATETATGASGTALIDQTQNPTPTGNAVAVVATPAFILADGSATSTITATVTSTSGPVSGDTVQFSPSGTGIGTLSASFAATNGSGVASVTYTASTTLYATATVTATEANGGASGNATVEQVPNVAVVATPTSVAPSGTSAITVTVTHQGVGVPGLLIGIGVSGVCGTVNPNFGNTLQNGTFTTTYTGPSSGAAPGSTCNLIAGVQGVNTPFTITNTG